MRLINTNDKSILSNVPRNSIVNICLHEVLFTTEKINSSYSWSFIPVRDNNSTTSKQNSNKQTETGFGFC